MSVISDFLVKQVREKGWLSIANLTFESAVGVKNPATSGGLICLSPSEQLVFAVSRMDTHSTFVIENAYLAQDCSHAGVEQTINVVSFERLQQFDTLLLSQWYRETPKGDAFVAPKYPKMDEIEAMVQDKETKLYPGTDTMEMISGRKESTISPYPNDTNVKDYVGLRVEGVQEFIKTQKKFCKLVQDLYGINDCI